MPFVKCDHCLQTFCSPKNLRIHVSKLHSCNDDGASEHKKRKHWMQSTASSSFTFGAAAVGGGAPAELVLDGGSVTLCNPRLCSAT